MPTYYVENYEIYLQQLEVEGIDEADAIAKVFQGEGKMVSMEFAGLAELYGMSLGENLDLASQLLDRGVIDTTDTIVPSIRSVQEIKS